MLIENTKVQGFEPALRGMRNPKDSWDKSDSYRNDISGCWAVGPKDLELACKLIKAGPEHRKFMRQIIIWVDLTLPRYVWTELDTYKVSTVRNSCSTMHKLGSRDLEQSDFALPIPKSWLESLNTLGSRVRNASAIDKNVARREIKNLLPEGYLQKATYLLSYETALSIYAQRRRHRLPEWQALVENSICAWIYGLPYMSSFIGSMTGS